MARTAEDLQNLVEGMNVICNNYDIRMNVKNTKYMTFSKNPIHATSIAINGTQLEKVSKYKYLRTHINETGDQHHEMKRHIEIALLPL
ncbi:unnamed protein product [Diabrotica balteata]|uniref:Uncharacterized protein n=1 Tax=Diabrotica balteata TaxID=107213 RepID=A0A9N9SUK2_DIABA|nr:unnamed protein product [Diabrotica balteata]